MDAAVRSDLTWIDGAIRKPRLKAGFFIGMLKSKKAENLPPSCLRFTNDGGGANGDGASDGDANDGGASADDASRDGANPSAGDASDRGASDDDARRDANVLAQA
jgi:hypothetical protein